MAPSSSHYKSSTSIPLPNLAHLTEQETLDKIDAEIAHFERHIQSLRQLRNTVVPIARLPTEILSTVFLHCHQLDYLTYSSRLQITWVCRHWRNVALGYPTLWSYIGVFHDDSHCDPVVVEHLQACLDRSQNVPLTILYEGPRCQLLTRCAAHASRIRQLRLEQDTEDRSQPLLDGLKSPAPLLTNMYLSKFDINDGIFGGVHPLLHTLHLSDCEHDWTSPLPNMSTLTTLDISDPIELVLPAVLAMMLQKLPALRSCTLSNCFDCAADSDAPGPSPTTTETIRLPNLKYLSIEDYEFDDMSAFVEQLDIPKASLDMLLHAGRIPKAVFKKAFKWFKSYMDRKAWKDIHSVHVHDGTEIGWSGSLTATTYTPSRTFTFSLLGSFGGDFGFDPVVIASKYLKSDTTKRLSLHSVSIDGLKSFGPFPRLESLRVENMGDEFKQWARTDAKKFLPAVTDLNVDGAAYAGFEDFLAEKDVEVDYRSTIANGDVDSANVNVEE